MGYFIKDEVIYGGDTDFTFASVSAMNTAITNGNVPDGAVCYVQGEGIYKISGTTPVKYGSLGGGSGGGGYHMASSDTAGATAAKVVTTTSGDYTPATGTGLFVKFDYDNTANGVTLNVDDSGVKTLQWNGSAISASAIKAGILYNVIYDGTYYQIVGSVAGVDVYDNSNSGLTATNVQGAIDEIDGRVDSAETELAKTFILTNKSLTFSNLVATVSDARVTASTYAMVYFTDATLSAAANAGIVVDTSTGTITFTATTAPTTTLVCDIVCRKG